MIPSVWRAFFKIRHFKKIYFFQHGSILNIPQNKQKAAEGMPGMTVTHVGRAAEVSTVLYIAAKQHIHLWHEDSFQENKCTKCWLNFSISLHSQTGQEISSVTVSVMVHLWMDFSVFQGVAPLPWFLSNYKSSQCMQLLLKCVQNVLLTKW